jgi:hypothetical protein
VGHRRLWIVAIVSTVVAFAIWLILRVISVDTEITELYSWAKQDT